MVRKTMTMFGCLSLVLAAVAVPPENANATITVITSSQRPVSISGVDPATIKIFNLDAVQDIEDELSRDLPTNETEALAISQQRINKIGQAKLNENLMNAYSGVLTAMMLGVDRYPAIIFENKFVVYGVTNVAVALVKYHVWCEEELTSHD